MDGADGRRERGVAWSGRAARAALVAAALVAADAARGDDSVLVFPALGRPTLVTVAGRVLAVTPEDAGGKLRKNLERLAAKAREHEPVEVAWAGQVRRTRTDGEGFFEASFPAPASAPFPAGLATVKVTTPRTAGEGRVQVVADDAPFLLVSDLDDTLVVTHVASTRDTLDAAFLKDETTQPPVPGMSALTGCMLAGAAPAGGMVVVSGSPVGFTPRVAAYLARNGFPFAALRLRRLGPATVSGYKEPILRELLSRFPQPVVLLGDSGEKDPEVYATIRAEFPGRVRAVFIRDAGGTPSLPARYEGMTLFRDPGAAARVAAGAGIADAACVERAFPPPPTRADAPASDR
jgi:hypothetical protein